jgi:UDP-N-acetylglucosamine--N-acetylmuramyl-(pentapeptide) pyrophosphoryl-undecaprenol N-acetylglucosamine transferase
MRVAVTGGGTGGHIYPAIAVAEALRRSSPDVEIVYIGAVGGREETVAAEFGLPFVGVAARKIRRLISLDTVVSLLVLGRGYLQARARLRELSPDAVVCTGGYVAASAALAAETMGIPVVVHEQNAVAGRTNVRVARRAARVCVTYTESASVFPRDKVVVAGLPVRAAVLAMPGRDEARARLGIPTDAFVIFVTGGSQGAAAINAVVWEAIGSLQPGVHVIHQTGAIGAPRDVVPADGCGYQALAFLDTPTVTAAYAAADLAVCRCGASTLAEVAIAGLPAVLVPFPAAYADHQTANARAVEKAGAGVLVPQSDLTPERLLREIRLLREDSGARGAMASASAALGRPHAADHVARVVVACIPGAGPPAAGAG